MKSCGYIDKYKVKKKNKGCYILLRGEPKKKPIKLRNKKNKWKNWTKTLN